MVKLSIAEINHLREKAEEERKKHHSICKEITSKEEQWLSNSSDTMTEEFQLEILNRNRTDEVMGLLESFAKQRRKNEAKRELSPKFQLKLYSQRIQRPEQVDYMLTNCRICAELEKILIDTKGSYILDKKSEIGEHYLLSSILIPAIKEDKVQNFELIREYYARQRFCPTAEVLFVNITSTVRTGRDRTIDGAEKLLKDYIRRYGSLCETAENALIKNKEHYLIMYYLEVSPQALSFKSSEELLLERGNKEEVELYFKRYSML